MRGVCRTAVPPAVQEATSPTDQATSRPGSEAPAPPEWWQERARWSFRTAADYAAWEPDNGPKAEHDYDPFEDV